MKLALLLCGFIALALCQISIKLFPHKNCRDFDQLKRNAESAPCALYADGKLVGKIKILELAKNDDSFSAVLSNGDCSLLKGNSEAEKLMIVLSGKNRSLSVDKEYLNSVSVAGSMVRGWLWLIVSLACAVLAALAYLLV